MLADFNVTDEDGGGRDECAGVDAWSFSPKLDDQAPSPSNRNDVTHCPSNVRSLVPEHRHRTPLRGTLVIPRPAENDPDYTDINYRYAGKAGHIHEVVTIGGRELAKVGFDDKKIVYYRLVDLEIDDGAKKTTFHDAP